MPLGDLAHVLRHANAGDADARLLVGPGTFDDAGVVRFDANRALVQTVDFFPPIVDDPLWFGRIAAANALSDVYAMGGRPLSVLNIAGFPEELDTTTIEAILQGAAEKTKEAGAVLAGGHTIRSGEVLFGLSVTGEVHPDRVTANTGANPGDKLYLTKPLGMGAAATAIKKEKLSLEQALAAMEQMARLNDKAAEAMLAAGARCATDITGYGLLGHARNIARGSGVALRFFASKLPIFPASLELAKKGMLSGGAKRNPESFGADCAIARGVPEFLSQLAFDSETSGGLLIAIAPEKAAKLEAEFLARAVPGVFVGEAIAKTTTWIELQP